MRREGGPSTVLRSELASRLREFIESMEERGVGAGQWNDLGAELAALEAGEPVLVADWKIPADVRPYPLGRPAWYRLEADDSLTPVELG